MKPKEILKKGMCVEFANEDKDKDKNIGIFDGYDFFSLYDMKFLTHESLFDDNLFDEEGDNNFNITKIWKDYTLKELLWERKTQILDKVEKKYFEGILYPFKNKIRFISKQSSYANYSYYISMELDDDEFISLPYFDITSTMYQGMEVNKKYTPKELDLLGLNCKITLKEFFDSKKALAIHCDTEEKANELLAAFDKLHKKWEGGDSYLVLNKWERYMNGTIYYNDGMYGSVEYAIEFTKDKIYEFEEVDLDE